MSGSAFRRTPTYVGSLLVALLGTCAAHAQSARELTAAGNEHYAAGRYAEALASYEAAAATGAPALEILHNQAAAHFKLGDLEAARDAWVRLKERGDAAFEARTRYNLGNCDYAAALAAAQDPQRASQALEQLGAAIEEYRTALRLDPELQDARANLELAHVLRKQIEEQLQQQPQSQPSSQPQQQNSESQPSSQPQQQQQPQSQPSDQQNQQQDQQGEQQQQDQQQQPGEPNDPLDPNQFGEPQEPNEPDPNQPQDPNQNGPPPDPNQAQDPNGAPEGTPNQPPPEQASAESQPAGEPREVEMSQEQAERLLQRIRDLEKARREWLLKQRRANQKPVERDW